MKAVLVFAVLAGGLGGPALAGMTCETVGNVTNCTNEGSLAPTQDRGCLRLEEADASMTPPDLVLSALDCDRAGRTGDLAELYLLLMARGIFDGKRVTDVSAPQAIWVLREEFVAQISAAGGDAVQAELERLMGDKSGPDHAAFCARIMAVPAPDYVPDYMIAHGMAAMLDEGADPLVEGFDGLAEWAAVLREEFECVGG